jgi:hypothetical protein
MIGFMLDLTSYIESPYAIWMPIALLAALAVLFVLGLIYMISTVLGRTDFRTWVRVKIYDVFFSIVIIFIFFCVLTAYFDVNPVPYYGSLGLVPNGAEGNCEAVTDYISLAACDMQTFISYSLNLNNFVYTTMIDFSLIPDVKVDTTSLAADAQIADSGLGFSFTYSFSPVPAQTFVGGMIGAIYPLLLINEVQLLILSASLLIFSVAMSVGLIARIFGVSRSFGGSMIALAVGIGVLYPLLVSLTYGFLDAGMQAASGCVPPVSYVGLCLLNVEEFGAIISQVFTLVVIASTNFGGVLAPFGALATWLIGNIISYAGIVLLGISLIPLLNFLIVDTFIIDFSRAIGEKVDFMSLLTSII